MDVRIGTSGWQYDDWRGRLYPAGEPKRRWLDLYARTFDTVELNNSFYRLPEAETFERWAAGSPAGFLFAVKASRFLTHIRRLREPADPVALFWSRAVKLGDKLGPVLFQLPPRFPADPDRLRAVLRVLPAGMRPAFEFRDRSWERDDVFEALDAAGAAFVLADTPGSHVPGVVTGGWTYVRFHRGTTEGPGYRRDKLRRWAKRLGSLPAREAYVYFNNDTGGAAVRDAIAFAGMLGLAVPATGT